MNDMNGNFIIETKNGGLYAASGIRIDKDWVLTQSEGLTSSFMVDDIQSVYEVGQKETKLQEINHSNYIAASILRVEKLIQKFQETHGAYAKNLEIVVCGAVSLALTVLPNRTTKDLDLVAKGTFIEFLRHEEKRTNLEIEVINPSFLFALGFWRERASKLIGYQNTQFLLLHPLDTVAQKLLRLQPDRFETKDKPDIEQIIQTCHPSTQTLVNLLTENSTRFRMAVEEEELAMIRNTKWFLKKYLPNYTYEQLKELALERRQTDLTESGLSPLDPVDLRRTLPIKKVGFDETPPLP